MVSRDPTSLLQTSHSRSFLKAESLKYAVKMLDGGQKGGLGAEWARENVLFGQVWNSSQRASKKPSISISLKLLRYLPSTRNLELQNGTAGFCGTNGNADWQVWSAVPMWGSYHPSSASPFQLPYPFAWAVEQSQLHCHQLYKTELTFSLLMLCPELLQSLFCISIKNNNAFCSASEGPLLICPHLFQTPLVFLSFTSIIILCPHLFLPLLRRLWTRFIAEIYKTTQSAFTQQTR